MKLVRAFSTELKNGELVPIKDVAKLVLGNILPNTQKSVRGAIGAAQVYCEEQQLGAIVPDYSSDRKLQGWHWANRRSQEFTGRYWARRNRQELQAIYRKKRLGGVIEARNLLPPRERERIVQTERTAFVEACPAAKGWVVTNDGIIQRAN